MGNNINSASRVKKLFTQALNRPNKKVDEVWADLFKISEQESNKRNFQVSTCLTQMHDEIELVREQMQKTNFSISLFNPMLDQANSIVAVQNLTGTWDAYKPRITPELILCLGFCSEILESDENEISEEQIREILNLLIPLEEQLQSSQLPLHTKNIIKKHLEKIKEAISSYPIVGAKGFNEVMQSAYGEVVDNLSVFEWSSPDFADTTKKSHNRRGGVSWQNGEAFRGNLNTRLSRWRQGRTCPSRKWQRI